MSGLGLAHPLNLLLLGSAAVSAALTGSILPILVGAGAELVWLAGSLLRGNRGGEDKAALAAKDEQTLLRALGDDDRRRFLALERVKGDIRQLVATHPGLSMALLVGELEKIDRLVAAFLRTAVMIARQEQATKATDLDALEAEHRRQGAIVDREAEAATKAAAAQHLAVLAERLEVAAGAKRAIEAGRSQLNLIESSLALLRDKVVSMQSPEEIAAPLDELMAGVAAIDTAAKETEAVGAPHRLAARTGQRTLD